MRKYWAILVILVMVGMVPQAAKACWFTDMLITSSDLVCSATYEQKQEAGAMVIAMIVAGATGADAIAIQSALTVLKNGGCFLISQLKEAFAIVDAANAVTQAKQAKMIEGASASLPQYSALRVLVANAKK